VAQGGGGLIGKLLIRIAQGFEEQFRGDIGAEELESDDSGPALVDRSEGLAVTDQSASPFHWQMTRNLHERNAQPGIALSKLSAEGWNSFRPDRSENKGRVGSSGVHGAEKIERPFRNRPTVMGKLAVEPQGTNRR
jgi:hypothetical protein